MSLDRIKIQRYVFSILECLGDVGGLHEILAIIFGLIYGVFHYETYEEFMTSKLYRKKPENLDTPK